MEILKNSPFVESINREIASQPQSRTQVLEVPWRSEVVLWPVDHGELYITVVRGEGLIKSAVAENRLEAGDQVHLVEGDEFALLPADADLAFVVQMYWAPGECGK